MIQWLRLHDFNVGDMGSILSLVGRLKSHVLCYAVPPIWQKYEKKRKKELKIGTKIKLQIGKLERWKAKLEGGGEKGGGEVGGKGEEKDGGGRGRKEERREKETPWMPNNRASVTHFSFQQYKEELCNHLKVIAG